MFCMLMFSDSGALSPEDTKNNDAAMANFGGRSHVLVKRQFLGGLVPILHIGRQIKRTLGIRPDRRSGPSRVGFRPSRPSLPSRPTRRIIPSGPGNPCPQNMTAWCLNGHVFCGRGRRRRRDINMRYVF